MPTKKCGRGHEYPVDKRQCPECRQQYRDANKEKSSAYYAANKSRISAVNKAWRDANGARYAAYREANKGRIAATKKAWSNANKEKISAAKSAAYRANKPSVFEYHLQRDYGLSVEEYARLLHSQGMRCAACPSGLLLDKGTHVDHNHQTGAVRGVLCHHCNAALGMVRDSTATLLRLVDYLKSSSRRSDTPARGGELDWSI